MEAADLRPLSLGELLDRTFSIYRGNFWLFVGIMAIPSAFSIPFNIVFMSARASAFGGVPTSAVPGVGVLFFVGISLLFAWTAYSLAIGAATYAVSECYLGHPVTVRGSYVKVRGKLWKIAGVVTVAFLRAMGMFLLIEGMGVGIIVAILSALSFALTGAARFEPRTIFPIILGVMFGLAYLTGFCLWLLWSLRYAVSIPALLLERLGVLAALRRSVQLTSGGRWRLLVAIMLCGVIAYVGVIIFQGPFLAAMIFTARPGQQPEWLIFASSVFGAIGGSLTGSLLMIVLVLCYYDTRIRKEAFDLQFMMSELEPPIPAPNPGTASPA
jgi:hypothetical protein